MIYLTENIIIQTLEKALLGIAGFIVVCLICIAAVVGIFLLIGLFSPGHRQRAEMKKKKKEILAGLSPKEIVEINKRRIPWQGNKNFLMEKDYVYETAETQTDFIIKVLAQWEMTSLNHPEKVHRGYQLDEIHICKEIFNNLEIKPGDIITVLYKRGEHGYCRADILYGAEETKSW